MKLPRPARAILMFAFGALVVLPLEPAALQPAVSAPPSAIFPVFASGAGEFTGLSFVNTSTVTNMVTVTWTSSDGNSVRTASLSLTPGSQRAALAREILGTPEDPTEGWIRIESSADGLLAYMASGQDGILDGTEPASTVSTRLLLPHVSVNTGFMELEHTDTRVILINPGTGAASAQTELIGLDGSVAGTLNVPVPAGASRTLRISESFRDALPSNNVGGRVFRGYMKVSSNEGLAAWLQIDKPLSRGLYRGREVEEIVPAHSAMVSHFAFGSRALYLSELNLVNAGDETVTLELAAQDDRGGNIGETVRRTLKPGHGFREDVVNLFRIVVPAIYPPPLVTGYIRIRAADGAMFKAMGDIQINCQGTAAMLYPIETTFSSQAILPFAVTDAHYFTGYALANPNEMLTVQTDVTIELLDQEGRAVGKPRNVSLSPAARFVSLTEETIRSGYIRIRANGPIAVLGAIGSWNCSMLAPLPAERGSAQNVFASPGK